MTQTPGSVLVARDLVKTYGVGSATVHALRGISLTIDRGDYVAIMGASGSGKSTLMNILGCLDVATSGTYELGGLDVLELADDDLADIRNQYLGFVFQALNLIPRMTALTNVELPLVYAGVHRAERHQRARAALESVGLGDRLLHRPTQLSGGQQQRVAVARAIINNPALIFADEPTGALDSVATAELLEMLDRLNAGGRTIVMVTHEDEVAAHTKRVIRLRDGSIASDVRRAAVEELPPALHGSEQAA